LYRSPEVRASPEPLLGPTQALGVDLSELKGLDAPSVPSSKPMPSAPTGKVQTEEERELAELEASMAM